MSVKFSVDFNVPFHAPTLQGYNPSKTLGEEIGPLFFFSRTDKNSLKFFDWYSAISNKYVLDLDEQDLELLKTTIENAPELIAGVKAQALRIIQRAKNKPTTKESLTSGNNPASPEDYNDGSLSSVG